MTKKNYVLDTSALVSGGVKTLYDFQDNNVIVPLIVVRELEKIRTKPEIGFIARDLLRELEKIRTNSPEGSLKEGVPTPNGGTIRIEVNHVGSPEGVPESIIQGGNDAVILRVASNIKKEFPGEKLILVTNDLPMRILASVAFGLEAREYVSIYSKQGDFTGVQESQTLTKSDLDLLYKAGSLTIEEDADPTSAHNECVLIPSNGIKTVAVLKKGNTLTPLPEKNAFGIKGRSLEQKVALNYLQNPEIDVVSLGGPAGTGKTLLALASGLEQVLSGEKYKKVVVFRPLISVGGQSLGFLPGTEEEKMAPWAGAVFDALEVLAEPITRKEIDERGVLEVLPITHIRGRTLTNSFIVIDEAQNLERNVLLSILSRTGENSKVVLAWDAAQKDNLNIAQGDGVVSLVERLKRENIFAHITLQKSERSRLAALSTRILEENS